MRGRTNVSGGGEGINLGAEVQEFTVADGNNITAGNFVQYHVENRNQKYESNGFFEERFYNSGNGYSKVIPMGNDKYILWYSNSDSQSTPFYLSIVDVSNGFNILSTISIVNYPFQDCCLLGDGNIAVAYMAESNKITIRIYKFQNTLSLLNTYTTTEESRTGMGYVHLTQIGDSSIIVSCANHFFICKYANGVINSSKYVKLEILNAKHYKISDWSMYMVGSNKIIVFSMSGSGNGIGNNFSSVYLLGISENNISIISRLSLGNACTNGALWGNAFGINKKVLFSDGFLDSSPSDANASAEECYKTKIYYLNDESVAFTMNYDLLQEARDAFSDLNSQLIIRPSVYDSSGTAQYVKENVFYAAVLPKYGSFNPQNRAAIFRVTYNPTTGSFERSNIVTIEGEESGDCAGYGKFFESEEGNVYYLYETSLSGSGKTGRWLLRMTYKNGILEKGANTQYVENYSGNAAIGVAKESGKPGQTIEVYVPTPV